MRSYNKTSGLWEKAGWWTSASIITMMANYEIVNRAARGDNLPVFQTTHAQASQNQPKAVKILSALTSMNTFLYPDIPGGLELPDPKYMQGYLDGYYDDEGWWALAWLKVYDLTHDVRYINAAVTIFDDMTQGHPAKCGGIWWDKHQTANVAITNELFFTIAAELANRVANRAYYREWALTMWHWFEASGLINAQNNVDNGLDLSTCLPNEGFVWSHNQGVIIGGLLELYQANANETYITIAENIATAAITTLSDPQGILHEKCEPNCGSDAPQYKGIFMRNLQYLEQARPNEAVKTFIENNANTLWARAQDFNGEFGVVWSGPPGSSSVATHSSALDGLVAAIAMG